MKNGSGFTTSAPARPGGLLSYRMGWQAAQRDTPPIPSEPTDLGELKRIGDEIKAYRRTQERRLLGYSLAFVAIGLL